MRRAGLAILAWFVLCGAAQAAPSICPLRSERPMIEAQLFFGRQIDNRGPVTMKEWSDFAATVIAKVFPEGFTMMDGEGAWLDPESKSEIREDTKIVLIVAKQSRDLAAKLTKVIDAYKARFRQHSVGLVTRQVCAAF